MFTVPVNNYSNIYDTAYNTIQGGLDGFLDYYRQKKNDIYAGQGTKEFLRTEHLQNAQMLFNAEQNRINREWQENLSNTAYQRATEDLKRAGINPVLVGGLGQSMTPQINSATSGTYHAPYTSSAQISANASMINTMSNNMTKMNTTMMNNMTSMTNSLLNNASDLVKVAFGLA